jgi:uncharacterized protein YndB with AHSA1/START domain
MAAAPPAGARPVPTRPAPPGEYRFLTSWLLTAERERVWDAIWDSERWPEWWRGVRRAVETEPGDPGGIGRRGRYEWRSRIPYPVRFEVVSTVVERPHVLAGEATGGLIGSGTWRFFEDGGVTAVLYDWRVRPGKRWMNALAPLARPVFVWNHDQVMRWGGEGLARHLGAELLAHS